MASLEMNAVISQKIEVAPGLAIFSVQPLGWELPDFIPGQFTVIGLPGSAKRTERSEPEETPTDPDKLIKRAYSIASGSIAKDHLEFYIKLVHSGQLTPRLFNLVTGDKLWLSPKITGMFTLDQVPEDKDIILFATGTGVAPYMSMLRSSVINSENRKYAVVHGAYNSWDLGYRSELLTIERLAPNFSYIPIISHPQSEPLGWNGLVGYVQKIWQDRFLQNKWGKEITPDNARFFFCGHPNMITEMVELLGKDGFKEHKKKDPGSIHLERFW